MRYMPGDVVVLWEGWRGWSWVWERLREGKVLSVLQEVVWANLVRLISGPIHVGMIATQGARLRDVLVYDSFEEGVRIRGFWTWPDEVAVYRPNNMTPDEIMRVMDVWERWIEEGVGYGWARNLAHFLDYVVELFVWLPWLLYLSARDEDRWRRPHVVLFRRLIPGGRTWGRECSNAVVAAIYEGTGKDFGYRWADPGDVDRFCRESGRYSAVLVKGSTRAALDAGVP